MNKKLLEKTDILKKDVFALYIAMKRKDTPLIAKIVVAVVVAYVLSPIDLIPDFIPIIGYLDDLVLIPLAMLIVYKLIPSEIIDECREEALNVEIYNTLEGKIGAFIILCIWIILMGIIIYNIMLIMSK